VNQPAIFAVELRRAGEILTQSGSGNEAATAAALAAVTAALRGLGAAEPVVPIESLAPTTPSAATAPAPPPPKSPPLLTTPADRARASGAARSPVPAAAPPSAESAAGIAGSWTLYERQVAAGVGPASLDVLLAPSPGHRTTPRGDAVVDIGTLIYRGARAQQRARELREAAKRASGDDLRAIIDEVCDLVVLTIEPES
jgi:hypothetical protein